MGLVSTDDGWRAPDWVWKRTEPPVPGRRLMRPARPATRPVCVSGSRAETTGRARTLSYLGPDSASAAEDRGSGAVLLGLTSRRPKSVAQPS